MAHGQPLPKSQPLWLQQAPPPQAGAGPTPVSLPPPVQVPLGSQQPGFCAEGPGKQAGVLGARGGGRGLHSQGDPGGRRGPSGGRPEPPRRRPRLLMGRALGLGGSRGRRPSPGARRPAPPRPPAWLRASAPRRRPRPPRRQSSVPNPGRAPRPGSGWSGSACSPASSRCQRRRPVGHTPAGAQVRAAGLRSWSPTLPQPPRPPAVTCWRNSMPPQVSSLNP